MGSGDGLHTATAFLLATATFTSGTFLFCDVSKEMAEENILRFGKESSPKTVRTSLMPSKCIDDDDEHTQWC